MSIDFDPQRWDRLRETYRLWWAGELERPIIPVELAGRDPGRPMPDVPRLTQATCHRLDIPADAIVDRIDYDLSTLHFLGDAYPRVNFDAFGPVVIAAMLGARLENSSGQVWFLPETKRPIGEIHFQFDPGNVWFQRIRDICLAGLRRWQGRALIGMPDLGGNLDILAVFRPGEQLLLDLYDHPQEVKRLLDEAHACWHRVVEEINGILQPLNPGYSDWSGIFTERPSYMLQCDFSYMIGPEMFDRFAAPEIAATCARLPYSFYHLDGVDALVHLGSVLAIDALDGVQWVPGAGQLGCAHWPEVYRRIHAAGKKIQVVDGDLGGLDAVIRQIGTARGVHQFLIQAPAEESHSIRDQLKAYGID
ncbi:MAG: hypothetical protein GXY83_37505 [Rhodopirellula sp.]|nr:hypothetical protein [Rhodopirellula sp.]